jgi:hypothetical protein
MSLRGKEARTQKMSGRSEDANTNLNVHGLKPRSEENGDGKTSSIAQNRRSGALSADPWLKRVALTMILNTDI